MTEKFEYGTVVHHPQFGARMLIRPASKTEKRTINESLRERAWMSITLYPVGARCWVLLDFPGWEVVSD